MTAYDVQKDIHAISSLSVIFAAISLLYFLERVLSLVFRLRSILKQFQIISDTHEQYFGNITEYNISENVSVSHGLSRKFEVWKLKKTLY